MKPRVFNAALYAVFHFDKIWEAVNIKVLGSQLYYRYEPLYHMSSSYFYPSRITPTVKLEMLGNFDSNAGQGLLAVGHLSKQESTWPNTVNLKMWI